jgi:hypothetical protein
MGPLTQSAGLTSGFLIKNLPRSAGPGFYFEHVCDPRREVPFKHFLHLEETPVNVSFVTKISLGAPGRSSFDGHECWTRSSLTR